MFSEYSHLSDEELVLAADGELGSWRAARVRAHLAACWTCRARMRRIEETIAGFVQMRSHLDESLPPVAGARARLKAELEALAQSTNQRRPIPAALAGRPAAAAGAALALGLCILFVAQFGSRKFWPASLRAAAAIPRPNLTPGAVRPVLKDQICRDDAGNTAGMVPASLRRKVFEEYGIGDAEPTAYEVDYLITPELGGSDDIQNLWPEPYSKTVWNAHVKDALEAHLHQLVCSGQLDLGTAQQDISRDWIAAYKKYFHTDRPIRFSGGLRRE